MRRILMVHLDEMIGFKGLLSIHAMNSRTLKSAPENQICGASISAWGEEMVGLHCKAIGWVMELEELKDCLRYSSHR